MKSQSIWEPLLDSLQYYKRGNYQTFSFCFQRTIEYLQLNPASTVVNKLRQRFYHTLNRLGYIEIDTSSPSNDWSVAPNHIVRLKDYYIAIAPAGFIKKYLDRSSVGVHDFDIYVEDESIRPHCKILLEKVSVNPQTINFMKSSTIPVVDRISWTYLRSAPNINMISELFSVPIDHVPPSILSEGEKYDFNKNRWLDVDVKHVDRVGMFRIPVRENFSQIILRVDHIDGVKHYRVTNSEWAYLIAASRLRSYLGCIYKNQSNEFYCRVGVPLPTLMERMLVCYTLKNPLYRDGYFVFENIPLHVVKILSNKYPYLFEGNK